MDREPWPPADGRPPAEAAVAGQLERLGSHLSLAGLRLARLRENLEYGEDKLVLIQVRRDLDDAIAEVRRLALDARQREGS